MQKTLTELLQTEEFENLDFKELYWSNNADLVHDMLCMANSLISGERYLVLGIKDGSKEITGVNTDTNRKTKQQITDCLRGWNINHVPRLEIYTEERDAKTIDIIVMQEPTLRPVFVKKDKSVNGKLVRAGVIYTRDNDNNTPINSSASPEQMAALWAHHFGLNTPPLMRAVSYIQDIEGWKGISDLGDDTVIHYRLFPEFTITRRLSRAVVSDYRDDWLARFPDQDTPAQSFWVDVSYHSTIIKRMLFVGCDGFRYFVPSPDRGRSTGTFIYNSKRIYYIVWRLLSYIAHGKDHEKIMSDFLAISGIEIREDQ